MLLPTGNPSALDDGATRADEILGNTRRDVIDFAHTEPRQIERGMAHRGGDDEHLDRKISMVAQESHTRRRIIHFEGATHLFDCETLVTNRSA